MTAFESIGDLRLKGSSPGFRSSMYPYVVWESGGNGPRFGGGLVSSHIPKVPHYSHVQSHVASSKNTTCDSHTLLVAAVAIACGRTRTLSG